MDNVDSPVMRAVERLHVITSNGGGDHKIKRVASIDKKIVEHAIDIENKEADVNIKTCCGRTSDSRLLKFIASFSITSIIIIFSCYQLSKDNISCPDQNTYIGLITLLIGLWLKSPLS